MDLLLLLGLPLVLVIVFVWRSDTLTGAIGVILGVLCAAWLLRAIQTIDLQHAWSASPIPRIWYYVLVTGCGVAALTSVYYAVMGLVHLVWLRPRARVVASDTTERPLGTATKVCPNCGRTILARAIACKYCEADVPPQE
jgi:putative copper export protein